MSRSLETDQAAAAASRGKTVYFLFEIFWDGETEDPSYYSTRDDFTPYDTGVGDSSFTISPIIETLPEFVRSMSMGVGDLLTPQTAQFAFTSIPENASNIESELQYKMVQGVVVKIYLIFGISGQLRRSDWDPENLINTYVIDRIEPRQRSLVVHLRDWASFKGEKKVGLEITDIDFPDAPTGSYGKVLPLVIASYNRLHDLPCPMLDAGKSTTLDGFHGPGDTLIYVSDVTGFPTSGTIKIGSDTITYNDVDTSNNTFGTSSSPISADAITTPHNDGETVRESIAAYRFGVAHDTVSLIYNVRLGGQVVTPTTGASGSTGTTKNGETYTYLELSELPTISEPAPFAGETNFDAEFGGWSTQSPSNPALNPGNAISTSEDAIVTHATICADDDNLNLGLDFTTDESARTTGFSAAYLDVDYEVIPYKGEGESDDVAWPGPVVNIGQGGATVISKNMPEPSQESYKGRLADTNLDIANALDDSRALFAALANIEFNPSAVYVSGYQQENVTAYSSVSGYLTHILTSWREYGNSSDGDPLSFPSQSIDTASGPAVDSSEIAPKVIETGVLLVRPLEGPSAEEIDSAEIVFEFSERNPNPENVTVYYGFEITVGGVYTKKTKTLTITGGDATETDYAIGRINTAEEGVTGPFTRAEIEGMRAFVYASSYDGLGTPKALEDAIDQCDFDVESIRFRIFYPPKLTGADQKLGADAIELRDRLLRGSSGRITQSIPLTTYIRSNHSANPWAFFDGTTKVNIVVGASDVQTKILIYDVRFRVSEHKQINRQLTVEEAVCTASVQCAENIFSPVDVITRILEWDEMWGLNSDGDVDRSGWFDSTSLAAAVASGGFWEKWYLTRAFDQELTLNEILTQACADAGARVVWENGKFLFSRIGAPDFTGTDYEFDNTQFLSPAIRRSGMMELVGNDIGVYHTVNLTERVGQRSARGPEERRDELSVTMPWGVKRFTHRAETIRHQPTAGYLADRIIADIGWGKTITQMATPLDAFKCLVGDNVLVNDGNLITDAPGRIVSAAIPSATECRFVVSIAGTRERIASSGSTNYIDRFPTLGKMVFVIGGTVVAELSADGTWRFAGEVETGTPYFDASDTQSTLVEFDNGSSEWRFAICLDYGTPNYYTCFSIDSSGDARLNATSQFAGNPPTRLLTASTPTDYTALPVGMSWDNSDSTDGILARTSHLFDVVHNFGQTTVFEIQPNPPRSASALIAAFIGSSATPPITSYNGDNPGDGSALTPAPSLIHSGIKTGETLG